jgi:hypothetical protein
MPQETAVCSIILCIYLGRAAPLSQSASAEAVSVATTAGVSLALPKITKRVCYKGSVRCREARGCP